MKAPAQGARFRNKITGEVYRAHQFPNSSGWVMVCERNGTLRHAFGPTDDERDFSDRYEPVSAAVEIPFTSKELDTLLYCTDLMHADRPLWDKLKAHKVKL